MRAGRRPSCDSLRKQNVPRAQSLRVRARRRPNLASVRKYARLAREAPLQPRALAALHAAQLVHWDLKLENILMFNDGNTVKLCDFGLARAVPTARVLEISNQSEVQVRVSCEAHREAEADDHREDRRPARVLEEVGGRVPILQPGHVDYFGVVAEGL